MALRVLRRSSLLFVGLFFSCSSGGAVEGGVKHTDMGGHGGTGRDGGTVSQPDLLAISAAPDWTAVTSYLDSLWNENKSLLRELPSANSYYTANDNSVGARAYQYLPTPNLARRDVILDTLRSFKICGCADLAEHDAVMNHYIDPVVTKSAQIPTTPYSACVRTPENARSPTGSCGALNNTCGANVLHEDYAQDGWYGDSCNFGICSKAAESGWDSDGVGKGAADHLALQILNLRNRGMATDTLWQTLAGKWDGKGMNDRGFVSDGNYTTFKLALFKIAARVLGKPLPAGVDEKLKEAQGPNGGIRTTYAKDGGFSLDQKGNAFTTALTVLAYLKPVADF